VCTLSDIQYTLAPDKEGKEEGKTGSGEAPEKIFEPRPFKIKERAICKIYQ